MSKRTTLSTLIYDMAEGSPESSESREPENPMSTTIISLAEGGAKMTNPAAETGIIPMVTLTAEGKDNDDVQDARPTLDETLPSKPAVLAQQQTDVPKVTTPSVLIVEDTTELAEVIQATLERMNMVTAHETHGAKALTRFNAMNPDVVLLDIALPDMTGWKILEAIKVERESGSARKMPAIIVITAYGDPANRLVGKLQGVHSYLIKPFTAEEVERVVVEALGSTA